eukprot:5845570-Amphidinium_carterae.1
MDVPWREVKEVRNQLAKRGQSDYLHITSQLSMQLAINLHTSHSCNVLLAALHAKVLLLVRCSAKAAGAQAIPTITLLV